MIPIAEIFKVKPLKIRNSIPVFVNRTEVSIKKDRYERYHEVVRKEAFLHLCKHRFYDEVHHEMRSWLTNQLKGIEAKNIVDLGCGVGHWSGYLAKTFPNSKVVGIDLSYQMFRIAYDH